MKLFTQWRFILLSALFSLLGLGSAWAQLTKLEEGGVYHFVNANYTDKAMGATTPTSVAGVAKNLGSKAQLWYVAQTGDNGYVLRNLGYGTYLQANGQSSRWTLASTYESNNSCWIKLSAAGSNTVFKGYTYGDYGYAHIDGSSNVVGWESSANATQWTVTKVAMSDDAIQAALGIFNNVATYQTALDALFTDKACTELKVTFDENNASFKALPTTLQNMMRKVAGTTSWEEANKDNTKQSWGADYAKKYRVQLYEPYNEPECAASALGLNAHTNLNNPTGIFANNGDILYVMVKDEIKDGASLYLSYHIGHGELSGYANGFELHQGLNVIPVYNDGTNFCVNYVVHTFDTSNGKKGNKAKARKLSEYAPIKIHIEGGYINGYWNKLGDELYGEGDKNADWDYIEARATQKTVTVLGKYITLQFPLLDENTVTDDDVQRKGLASYFNELVKIEDCINEWDNVMLWERLLLGVLDENTINAEAKQSPYSDKATVFEYTGKDGEFESDYSDYYNIHGLSYGIPNSYMYGGWAHCGYNYSTMDGVIRDLPTNAGAHWGPGHEIGHQHQKLLTVNGLTEVTNNLFANVVLWYYGETTSRYNGDNGALSNVLAQFNAEGTDFFSNNIWAQTIMYYKLFLYYHVLGHNPKFYPRLFEMLRQDPMSTGYNQDGSKCLMHFYKKCCLAAGEDLTEFFRAHGFFEVMKERFVGDYSNSVYNLTQAQIDAAIKEVKDLEYKENIAVLFINDATGETIKSHKGDNLEKYGETTICSEIGSYASFATATTPSYNYAISGNTVTMEGSGGVGFAILNENGELIGFSDKKTFEISAEATAAIASGKASIVTLKADNTPVAATNVMDTGNTEEKYELLGELLGSAKQLLDLSDGTGTQVGYYRASSLTKLQEAYGSAKAVYDAQTIAAYSAVYDVLYQEYANLMNNDYARINITEGYAYRLTNKAYDDRSMGVKTAEGDDKNEMFGLTTANENAQLWYFEAGASPATYYLKNKATGLYPGDVSTGAVLKADKSDKTTDNGAYAYRLQNMGNGVFALVGKTGLHCSSSQSYNIVGWEADADATQWYITAEVVDETLEARSKLEETIAKTEALVNEMAEVKIKGSALDLTTCTITSNTPETGHETKYLVDGNPTTFFHTNWSGAAISENHNFIIDLGEGNSLEQFAFNYITLPSTQNNVDAPKAMVIEGSTNGTDYTSITSLSELPTTKGTTYASATLGTKGTAYRYLRFSVTDATGGKLGSYYYFGLAEFGLTNMQTELLSVKDAYSSSQTAILNACDGLYAANLVYNNEIATQAELQAAASTLNEDYTDLLNSYNAVKKAGLDAKKTELQALIDKTTALITECGSVKYTEETTPQLNTSATPYKLSDNNGKSGQGGLDKLYDGLQGEANSYTSSWSDTPTEPSYLQVDLGSGYELEELIFTFTNRNEGNAPTPTEIVVSASADGNEFTELATFTSAEPNWPPAANKQNIAATKWTSPEIKATSACRYWRFTVTKSQRSDGGETNKNGVYHFGISEFGIVIPAGCNVTVNDGMGGVTEELLLATYDENEEANSTLEFATTEAQLDKAIANLQAQYDALEAAKNVVDKSGLVSLIQTATARLNECGTVTPNGAVLDVTLNESNAGSVNKNMLRELYRAIEEAQGVIDNTKATQEDVNAEIAELTAQIEVVQTAKNSTAKADLKTVIEAAQTAINACASSITQEGGEYTVVWNFETAGDVDKATLIAAYEALVQANAVYNGDASTVSEYQVAKEALSTPIATLNEYKAGYHKSQLKSMVGLLTALIETCNTEGLGDLTTGMLEEMVQLNETATGYLTQEFATQEVLVSTIDGAISNIETNYPTWSAAQQSTAKAELRAMIAQLAELIDECGTVTEEGSEYVATLDPYAGVVTEEQLIAVYRAKVDAETLANNSAVAADLTAKKDALQTVYNDLHTDKNTNWLPVTLTRDINNPVLYTFKSARGTESIMTMQYDPTDAHSFSIVDKVDSNAKQAYFFMMGDTRDQVYVYPYAAAGMVLGADNTDNGANKVFAGEKGTQAYEQWTFVEQGDWYNLQPVGTSTYLSNINGTGYKIGFYSSDPNTDDGSRFQFEEVEIEGSSAYNSLKVYYDEVAKVQSSEIVGGDGVGYYPVTEANAYNTAYATATEVLNESSTVTYDHYWTLRKANEDLILNMPKAGKYYKIVSVSDKGYCNTALAYANENNGAQFSKDMTSTNARAVWEFIPSGDGFHVRNLHTDSHIGTLGWGAAHTLQEETAVVKIEAVNGQGLVKLINGQPMHAQETNSVIVGYPGNLGSASIWSIQEVDIDDVTYPLTITQFGYAGLHLNYPVELPDGLTAYTIYSAEGANGIARMRPISGSVIPANTGVIIEGKQGNYDLNYQVYEGEELDNLLSGSNYTRYVKADDYTDYFVFAAKKQTDGSYKVGLYITWEEFDATGSTDIKDDKGNVVTPNGNKNSHDGGYFKSSANKIFLPCSNEAGAAKFFFQRDSDITDIDSLLNGLNSDDEVYDLQGRRISKVTKEGIYIVNGQKRYLKATKF